MRRKQNLPYFFYVLLFCGFIGACTPEPSREINEREVALAWADLSLYITQFTPSNSPTYASRCFGYIGLTMYESIVHGYPEYKSLAGQLTDLETLPLPEANQDYNWILALNAGQATILKRIYNQTSDANKAKIDSLASVFYDHFSRLGSSTAAAKRSAKYGEAIAEAIFEWSMKDGGHRGYLHNFDKEFKGPQRPGSWVPPLFAQSFSHHPLHPYWGENRRFVPANATIELPEMIPYDTAVGSPYYEQFLAVYKKEQELTQEEKEIAIWWSDDPDSTFTPPGHSYYLASTLIKEAQPTLIVSAETYARVGLAVADAFINCWQYKYHFFTERPNTYVPKFIDQQWESFWPDPPFPAFPSGHAIQAAAAADVLIDLYGNDLVFVDSAHVGRARDELRDTDFRAMPFNTVWQIAKETADSRFYGGIHTYQDNDVGLEKGKEVAKNVNTLNWKTEK